LARTTTVVFIDDLDGTPATETVRFAVDGRSYEIDLSTQNAQHLRGSMAGFVAAARRTDRAHAGSRRGKESHRLADANPATVRAWANHNGVPVSSRGNIPHHVLAQYTSAQQAPAAEPTPAEPAMAEPAESVADESVGVESVGDKPKRSRRRRS